MKKFIYSAVAVAAFGVGGAAQADLIDGVGNTLSQIFGVPYDPRPSGAAPIVSTYTDAYGRRYQVDAAGQHYIVQNGRLVPFAGAPGTYAMAPSVDRDRDGVTDPYDRYPYDSRYR